ncbi:MAG: CPBP family intramembrane metalloprotease [Planctomycetes bacterium]|nr:CPBP family intramembrane metalloprotease [Planctomycetota bacterium]
MPDSTRSAGSRLAARWSRQARLTGKELRETLRDGRTIGTLLLMPILVYPLLSMAFQRFLLAELSSRAPGPAIAILERGGDFDQIGPWLELGVGELKRRGDADESSEVTLTGPRDERAVHDVEAAVRDGAAEIGLTIREGPDRRLDVHIAYREEIASLAALERIERLLAAAHARAVDDEVRRLGLEPLRALDVRRHRVESTPGTSPLATLVPLVLLLMTMTGAVYPAIDLTAGERERGTLETLIAAPVSRLSLLMAKYVAVVAVALLTATVNLVAMTVTVQVAGFAELLFGDEGVSPGVVVRVFALLVLFAAFFSAVLLSITSMARSFKEAQAYLIPLMLVSITPGLLSMAPGLELTPWLTAVPLVNLVLTARDLFRQTLDPALGTAAMVATLLYALAGLAFASRAFGTDSILAGSRRAWTDVGRRPSRPLDAASVGTSLACLAAAYPGQFLLGGWIAQARSVSLAGRLVAASLATLGLFAGIPLAAALWGRIRLAAGFRMHRAPVAAWVAGGVLGLTLWPAAHAAFQWGAASGFASLGDSELRRAATLVDDLRRVPVGLIVAAMGVVPAIAEEFFFRGFLLAALRTRLSGRGTVLVSALLFAAFHLVTPGMLAMERFVPSFLLGCVLGWLALRSGSIGPAVIAHGLHNGLLLSLLATFPVGAEPLKADSGWLDASLPAPWYALSAAGLIAGGLLLRACHPNSHPIPFDHGCKNGQAE